MPNAWLTVSVRLLHDSYQTSSANSHLKCKAGFCEDFEWSEIVESLSRSIVESIRDVCKGVV